MTGFISYFSGIIGISGLICCRRIRPLFFSLFLILNTAGLLQATNYYVSNIGNNGNPGTSADKPWLNVSRTFCRMLKPGDTVFFAGGQMHRSNIYLNDSIPLSRSRKIVFTSYGLKRAVIDAGDSAAFFFYNLAGISMYRMDITGSGSSSNKASGVVFYADDSLQHEGINITDCDISGFGGHGVLIAVENTKAAVFGQVLLDKVSSHDNLLSGINTMGSFLVPGHYSIEDLVIRDCAAFRNFGDPTYKENHSGNGIECGSVRNGLVERCLAYENGKNNGCMYAGPVGIWCWASTDFVIQHCESHHNHTGTLKDGGGFDLDGGVTNSVLQYNYSHDNDGSGYLVCQFAGAMELQNVTLRYNISENDGRKNETAGILFWSSGSAGGIQNAYVYNNTVYITPSKGNLAAGISVDSGEMQNLNFINNIIFANGGMPLVKVNEKALSAVSFKNNCYWAGKGSFMVQWGTHEYSALSDWQKESSQEAGSKGEGVGYFTEPGLISPGKGITLNNPFKLASLTGYQLKPGSSLAGRGLDLAVALGMDNGGFDFFGNRTLKSGQFSIGAHQPPK